MKIDISEVRRSLLLLAQGHVFEVRAFVSKNSYDFTVFGYFDDVNKAASQVAKQLVNANAIYFTLNPVDPALLARAPNRLVKVKRPTTTADGNIARRVRLLLDFDPKRPAGISASDAEKAAALTRATTVAQFLVSQCSWPEPVLADSGNGYHLLFTIDLPTDDGGLVHDVLKTLAARFNDTAVEIDTAVGNASRITKLYGTEAMKGFSVATRPHRMSGLMHAPAAMGTVSEAQLRALLASGGGSGAGAGTPPPPPGGASNTGSTPDARIRTARRIAAKWPPGMMGEKGSRPTYQLAGTLIHQHQLTEDEAYEVLLSVYSPRCQPSWSETELRHKVHSAATTWRGARAQGQAEANNDTPKKPPRKPAPIVQLAALLPDAEERLRRRRKGEEPRVPLPFADLKEVVGEGLFPGLIVIVGATGIGKTQLALQHAVAALRAGIPVGYVALEGTSLEIVTRLAALLGDGKAKWSTIWRGELSDTEVASKLAALAPLPFHLVEASPRSWCSDDLVDLAKHLRNAHPLEVDENGDALRGSAPMLIVIDFLQIVGADPDDALQRDLRERIGAAAYVGRDLARKLDAVVLLVSSAARDKYNLLGGDCLEAGLDTNTNAILRPEHLVGVGKESGEIEYAADLAMTAVRFKSSDNYTPVALVVAKNRAGKAGWVPLLFDGSRYIDDDDVPAGVTRARVRIGVQLAEQANAKKGGRESAKGSSENGSSKADPSTSPGSGPNKPTGAGQMSVITPEEVAAAAASVVNDDR